MKKPIMLIPLFVIIFLSCALFRTRQQLKTQSETTQITTAAEETTQEEKTTAHGVLDRLLGRDQETSKKEKQKAKKAAASTETSKNGKPVSPTGTTAKDGVLLPEDAVELIEELGINLDSITEKETTEIKMSLGNGVITETTSIKEIKPITSKRNSSGEISTAGNSSSPAAPAVKTDNEIIASGKYAMQATVKRNGGSPKSFRLYADGNKYALFTNVNFSGSGSIAVEVILNEDDVQFVVPKLNAYIDGGSADDYKFKKDVFDEVINPVKMTAGGENLAGIAVVKLGDKEYTVEEYKTEDGRTVKYYVLEGKTQRIEITDADGNSIILEISNLSGNVPSETFTIPSGYTDMTKAAGKHIDFLKEKSVF